MKRLLKVHSVQFRDANFSPDFAVSAERMIRIYNHTYSHHAVSLLAAVNYTMLENILKLLGTIRVGDRRLTGHNLFSTLTTEVSNIDLHDKEERSHRKSILSELFHAVALISAIRFWHWPGLRRLFWSSIENRDLQIYAQDPLLQQKFSRAGISLPFSPKSTDYLAIIDNNYLGVKSNRYIQRRVCHSVRFDYDTQKKCLGDAHINVRFTLEHIGSQNYPLSSVYQSYVSFYIPSHAIKARILSPRIAFEISQEENFTIIGADQRLDPGQHRTIEIEYLLPAYLFKEHEYSFSYLPQSGVTSETVFDTVTFPLQFNIQETSPSALVIRENTASFNASSSYHYALRAVEHNKPPRIFFHEIVAPQLIEIRFSEPVFASADDPVFIQDTLSGSPVEVVKTEFTHDHRRLFIHTSNLPNIKEQFYHVELSKLHNVAGIHLSPNPRCVTVVYRPQQFKTLPLS